MLNRILFVVSLLLATGLIALAITGPWYGDILAHSQALRLFAEDLLVRRTAFFCGLGLLATAAIFFRPRAKPSPDGSA